MGSSLLSIGAGALNAATLGLATTSHNIANANTAGYSRQVNLQATNTPQFTGNGYLGQGVHVASIRRQYGEFLTTQVRNTESDLSRLTSMLEPLKVIDDLLADPAAGLAPAMSEFFAAVNQLAQHPADAAARQGLIGQGNALAARFGVLNGQIDRLRGEANDKLQASVDAINSLAQQIVNVNQQIRLAQGGQPPNDLLDQRDQLILELNRQVQADVVKNDDGSVNVFLGNGQPLVVGDSRSTVITRRDPANAEKLLVGIQAGSRVVPFRAGDLAGGEIAGTIAFRDTILEDAQNSLGRIAIGLARAFNEQHRAGVDLTGQLGATFFREAAPNVIAHGDNTGTGAMGASVANVAALTTSDYRVSYDGTDYAVRRFSDGQVQSFGTLPQVVDGVRFELTSGAMAAGDSFLVQPTRNAAQELSVLVTEASRVAAGSPVVSSSAAANLGTGAIGAPVVTPPAAANLQQPVTITFTSPTTFDVTGTGTGNPTGIAFTPGGTISFNGWTVTLTGAPATGDSFSIGANVSGVGDNRNATALAQIQSLNIFEGGTAKLADAYGQLVSSVGNTGRSIAVTAEAGAKLADQAIAAREAVAGVNLDEEAANLMRYQQAYQAAAKVLAVAQSLFDELASLGR